MKTFNMIFIALIIIVSSCVADDTIIITKYFGNIRVEKEELPIDTEKLVLRTGQFESITKIEGVEKLKNLKYLYISHALDDFAFLEKLKNIEILAIEYNTPLDLSFLKEYKKLKILYLNMINLETTIIDFSNNNYLEFLYLGNLRSIEHKKFFELKLKNIPASLKCIDFSLSMYLIITEKLLDEIINVPLILAINDLKRVGDRFEVSEEYLQNHPNIHTDNIIKIRPKELQQNYIRGFFGVP